MTGNPEFDWVTGLAQCTPGKMFERLKLQVSADVDLRQKLRPERAPYTFYFTEEGPTFSALLEGNGIYQVVKFSLGEKEISISDENGKLIATVTTTLNDEGECRARLNGKDYELWQLRKMVLEALFFGTFRRVVS
jgi:hypothetical protein